MPKRKTPSPPTEKRARTERFTVELSDDECARLVHRGYVTGLSRSDVVRSVIREWPLPPPTPITRQA